VELASRPAPALPAAEPLPELGKRLTLPRMIDRVLGEKIPGQPFGAGEVTPDGVTDYQLRKLPSPAVRCFNPLRKGQLFLREKSCITKRLRLRRMFLELPEILLQCEIQPEVLHLAQTFQLGSKFV